MDAMGETMRRLLPRCCFFPLGTGESIISQNVVPFCRCRFAVSFSECISLLCVCMFIDTYQLYIYIYIYAGDMILQPYSD